MLLLTNPAYSQQFSHRAKLAPVKENGLHRMELSPDARAIASMDMSDIRLLDAKQQQVPYIIVLESLSKAGSDFVEYPLLKQHIQPGHYSELIIENRQKEKLSNFSLCITNSDVEKSCDISGSDDKKQWYALSEKQVLSSLYDVGYTQVYKSIYFPPVNYRYFRIVINDSNSAPLKINRAGNFKGSLVAGKLLDVAAAKTTVTQDAKNKTTRINVIFDNRQLVDRIDFTIAAPNYYKRPARVLVKRQQVLKHKTEVYEEELASFEINSAAALWFDMPAIKEKEFVIEINNQDNPALQVSQIKFKQLAAYLVSDLKAGEKYVLMLGNSALKAPRYDLNYFMDKIPRQIPEVAVGKVEQLIAPKPIDKKEAGKKEDLFMWLCIAAGALCIVCFSYRLLHDLKSGK